MVRDAVLGTEMSIDFAGLRFGTCYPDDIEPDARAGTAQLLKRLAFIRSPFVEVQEVKLPRPLRRHGGLPKADLEKTVSVVVLRRAAQKAIKEYESEPRQYKHRWWVSGHFRSQWYPSAHAHQVIWIAPYIKGPEGVAMLEKVYAVVR